MSQPYIGEIRAFGFNFAPVNWAFCNGQPMNISDNPTLFNVIGTTYGGNGTTTFNMPNLQGQVPMHWGTGPGGTTVFETVEEVVSAVLVEHIKLWVCGGTVLWFNVTEGVPPACPRL